MAAHEFGIMEQDPEYGVRYDTYEPWKYGCIDVPDEYVENVLEKNLEAKELKKLLRTAKNTNKYVIHYGILRYGFSYLAMPIKLNTITA